MLFRSRSKCRKLGKIVCRISGKLNAIFSGKVLAVYKGAVYSGGCKKETIPGPLKLYGSQAERKPSRIRSIYSHLIVIDECISEDNGLYLIPLHYSSP